MCNATRHNLDKNWTTIIMKKESNYIVQNVAFKTGMHSTEFIKRWAPFATGFKSAGIKTIDLYQAHTSAFAKKWIPQLIDHSTLY